MSTSQPLTLTYAASVVPEVSNSRYACRILVLSLLFVLGILLQFLVRYGLVWIRCCADRVKGT